MEWMILPLKRYAQFSGRSRRKEFWLYTLFVIIVSIVLAFIDAALGLGGSTAGQAAAGPGGVGAAGRINTGVLGGLFGLATLIPSIAVSIRRLHDTDRTGWWLLILAAPYVLGIGLLAAGGLSQSTPLLGAGAVLSGLGFIAAIVLLVFYCLRGTTGPNRFGDDPLGHTGEDLARTFD